MKDQTFELTADHVKLLRAANVDHNFGDYWGMIGLDCKRPFGNKDIVGDMARLLGDAPLENIDGEDLWPAGTHEKVHTLFGELATALQVVLAAGSFEPGWYQADQRACNWSRAEGAQYGQKEKA